MLPLLLLQFEFVVDIVTLLNEFGVTSVVDLVSVHSPASVIVTSKNPPERPVKV